MGVLGAANINRSGALSPCQFEVIKDKLILNLIGGKKFGLFKKNKVRAEVTGISLPLTKNGEVWLKLKNKNKSRFKYVTRVCDRYFGYNDEKNIAITTENSDKKKIKSDAFRHLIDIIYKLKNKSKLHNLVLGNFAESKMLKRSQKSYMDHFFVRERLDGTGKYKKFVETMINEALKEELREEIAKAKELREEIARYKLDQGKNCFQRNSKEGKSNNFRVGNRISGFTSKQGQWGGTTLGFGRTTHLNQDLYQSNTPYHQMNDHTHNSNAFGLKTRRRRLTDRLFRAENELSR